MAPEPNHQPPDGSASEPTSAPEARALALTCDLCEHRMQTVADLLLLTSDPRPVRTASLRVFGESVARCRETVASRCRGLAVLLRDLEALLQQPLASFTDIRVCVEEVCDLVVSLTECCAHAGYLLAVLTDGSTPETPGPVDRYQLCRAAAEIEHKTGLLTTYRLQTVTALQLTDICISVNDNAHVLTDACLKAADEVSYENIREQFRLCLKSVASNVNTFTGSIKFLKDRPNHFNYRACQVFGEGLMTSCNALAVFATQDPHLTGQGASLTTRGKDTLNGVLSGCMGVVAPCVLACALVREVTKDSSREKLLARLHQCQAAIVASSERLALALAATSK